MERPGELRGWVMTLPIARLDRAAVIRLDEGIMGALDPENGLVWLRGRQLSNAVFALPFFSLFQIEGATGRLFPFDSELPVERLSEELAWEPLSKLVHISELRPDFPVVDESSRARLQLKRGGDPDKAPNLLSVSLQKWSAYARTAPTIRLARLAFAASGEEALIRGTPPPPISGQSWFEENGIAIPCGWVIDPPVSAAVIRKAIRASQQETILLYPDGMIDRIAEENFVSASRAAVRLTATR